jgi:hypothetical protein
LGLAEALAGLLGSLCIKLEDLVPTMTALSWCSVREPQKLGKTDWYCFCFPFEHGSAAEGTAPLDPAVAGRILGRAAPVVGAAVATAPWPTGRGTARSGVELAGITAMRGASP